MNSTAPSRLMNRFAAAVAIPLALTACSTLTRNPVPIDAMGRATIPGMPGIRDWGDKPSPDFQEDILQSVRDESEAVGPDQDHAPNLTALVLSGGGSNGAFGAGYLVGWSDAGTRPVFKLVTGVSTGALIAPYAFLGSDYDVELTATYTQIRSKDVFKYRNPFTVLKRDSLAVTTPLVKLLETAIDTTMLEAIAAEHRRGRRLYVATTNLDAQRLMVWNMGAIAASDHPRSAQLFRQVLLASASIPVAFPPVYIDVEVDGTSYDEMHVDGGVIAEFFLWGATIDVSDAMDALDMAPPERTALYIIRNSQIDPEPRPVTRELVDIASRSMITLLKAVAMGDLMRLHALAERNGVEFNYIGIPAEHPEADAADFDPAEMRRLFDLGRDIATSEQPWRTTPPAFLGWISEDGP